MLKGSPLFGEFPDEVLARFTALGKKRAVPAGETLFVELSGGDEIFLITKGEVRVEFALANDDKQFDIVKLGPGEILGEVSFIESGQRSATVTAESDIEVLVWKCDDWRRICEEDPATGYKLAMGVARILCKRLRRWNLHMLEEVAWGLE